MRVHISLQFSELLKNEKWKKIFINGLRGVLLQSIWYGITTPIMIGLAWMLATVIRRSDTKIENNSVSPVVRSSWMERTIDAAVDEAISFLNEPMKIVIYNNFTDRVFLEKFMEEYVKLLDKWKAEYKYGIFLSAIESKVKFHFFLAKRDWEAMTPRDTILKEAGKTLYAKPVFENGVEILTGTTCEQLMSKGLDDSSEPNPWSKLLLSKEWNEVVSYIRKIGWYVKYYKHDTDVTERANQYFLPNVGFAHTVMSELSHALQTDPRTRTILERAILSQRDGQLSMGQLSEAILQEIIQALPVRPGLKPDPDMVACCFKINDRHYGVQLPRNKFRICVQNALKNMMRGSPTFSPQFQASNVVTATVPTVSISPLLTSHLTAK